MYAIRLTCPADDSEIKLNKYGSLWAYGPALTNNRTLGCTCRKSKNVSVKKSPREDPGNIRLSKT